MENPEALEQFAALAQQTRLDIFRLLVQAQPGGMLAGEIAGRLGVIQNTMSGNLATLSHAGLISGRREGRAIRYHIEIDAVRDLLSFLMEDCCGGRSELCDPTGPRGALPFEKAWMAGDRFNVLFIGTTNSTRSIIAEAIMNKDHGVRFNAFSAGTHPDARVDPDSLAVLTDLGYPVGNLQPKGWEEFTGPDAVKMDFVFTLCGNASQERCPVWPGAPMSAHWVVPDPKTTPGRAAGRQSTHTDTLYMLESRIHTFAKLPFATLERGEVLRQLTEIGAVNTASSLTE
jgi:ArsR family transcriptional regulator, arsenate/arsenite/antimonite-responsive transcriptional repressor / arsenate reductase (thioredoxin)